MKKHLITFAVVLTISNAAHAAPDEDKLCMDKGYPIGTPATWFLDECFRVGSFSNQAEIPNLARGNANVLAASTNPMPLSKTDSEPWYRWNIDQFRSLNIDDYMKRQRVTALLIIKDGVVQVERYQYDRNENHRFVSQSMAKSIAAIAVGFALQEGKIKSLDDRADTYEKGLLGTLYGETTIRNLLRMSSGAKFEEKYDGKDDLARYNRAMVEAGSAAEGAKVITQRNHPQGAFFNYASAETDMLALVLRAATGETLSQYLTTRLWQPMGAQTPAAWRASATGTELAAGNFNATARDFARLGILLANDGVREDLPGKPQIVPKDFLIEATTIAKHPAAFAPQKATPYFGYGYQFWTFPNNHPNNNPSNRRFALLGVYGQSIFVDPKEKLVMVQLGAWANSGTDSARQAGRERDALWRGVVAKYTNW